jgi:hypothetical protein
VDAVGEKVPVVAAGGLFDGRGLAASLALGADGQRVTVHDLRGKLVRELRLDRPAGPALAYDSDQREFYAPLRAWANWASRRGSWGASALKAC